MPVTVVRELGTDNEYTYTLPPKQAVVAAWYQYGHSNWNTWTYNHHLLKPGKYGWHMGNFSAPYAKEAK